LLSRELLTESGSIFVQISDENVHLVRSLMDEVFGVGNFVSLIYFTTTSGFSITAISRVGDYLVWYAKNKQKLTYRQLYLSKDNLERGDSAYKYIELTNGQRRPMTKEERDGFVPIPKNSKIYRLDNLQSQGGAKDIDETDWPGVTLLKAQMNADLLTEDLKK
jgi:adenine-specific DNA-methyltransferase